MLALVVMLALRVAAPTNASTCSANGGSVTCRRPPRQRLRRLRWSHGADDGIRPRADRRAALLLAFALRGATVLARVDWLLLLTFAAIFLGLGHLAELPSVRHGLDQIDFRQPLTLYLARHRRLADDQQCARHGAAARSGAGPDALAVAVNVGGFGVAIGSLANLIALRLAKQPHGMRLLHLVSIPFLLVCAPLVYLVWRWLHL